MGERASTKGPWEVREYGDGDSLVVHAGDDWRICFMATPGSSPNAIQRIEANARLIAAAPELLEQLILARRMMVIQMALFGDDVEGSPLIADIDRVIASSIGEAA